MSDLTSLNLLQNIARQAELPGAPVPLVLPVVHDAVGPEEPLLAAYADYHEGAFIRLDRRGAGADGPLDHSRVAVARAIFGKAGLDLRVDELGSRISASFGGHASPSGGLATALRVAEAFVSTEIDAPVVVLAYPLDGMDSAIARAVWTLMGLGISDSPPPSLRLWVPVAEGDVDVRRHCIPANPVRLAVQSDRVIVRGAATDMGAAISNLLVSRDQPIVLFLGAGASVSAGISLGDSVREQALAQVTGRSGAVEELVDGFYEWVAVRDRWREGEPSLTRTQFAEQLTLERVLREEFHALGGLPPGMSPTVATLTAECAAGLLRSPPGRQALQQIAEELPRLVVATVNFDRLIEDGLATPHQVIATPTAAEQHRALVEERTSGASGTLPILKLHGTIEDPTTLVADVEKTEIGLPDETAATLDAMLDAAGGPLTWVWIGCSMRDVDLKAWLRRKSGADQLREWWVDPLPGQSLFDYARYFRAAEWATMDQRLSDRLVTETADIFLPALLDHARNLPP
jgi:hypothetical protein